MALRYECDGCGKMLPRDIDMKHQAVSIRLATIAGARVIERDRHLCPRCMDHLAEITDPAQWPRVAMEDRA